VFRINPLSALVLLAFTVVAVPSAAQAKGGDLSVLSVWSDNGELIWNCLPQTFLRTMCGQYQNEKGPVPADGILQGSVTSDEQSGGARDVTYSWRLVPEN
jgi:hypothetical protein